jgi:hypothetical protein
MYSIGDSVEYILNCRTFLPRVMVLRAVDATQTPECQSAVRSLMETQNPDGGFPHWNRPGTPSTLGTTSWTLLYLGNIEQAKSTVEKAVEYLLRAPREVDGGWRAASVPDLPKGKSSVHLTSIVISALIRCGERSHPAVGEGIALLRRCWNHDGSWNRWSDGPKDPFDYDYMVRALHLNSAESDRRIIEQTAYYILSHRDMWRQDYFACSALLPCLLMAGYRSEHEAIYEMSTVLLGAREPNGSWVYPEEGQDTWLTAYIVEALLQCGYTP